MNKLNSPNITVGWKQPESTTLQDVHFTVDSGSCGATLSAECIQYVTISNYTVVFKKNFLLKKFRKKVFLKDTSFKRSFF